MYYSFYGLKQPPFRITPDTSLFFPGGDRGAVLEALVYAIVNGEGIVKVVGEVGSGKTMLCRMLEVELPEHVEIIYLANPSLTPDNILHAIAFELHLEVEPTTPRLQVMHQIQNLLIEKHAAGKQIVMFVEEAQAIPLETLEEIRLLSNLETHQHKLLQIVLFGQPELDENLSGQEIRQLRERITYSFNLSPFRQQDVRDYVNARLRASGHKSSEVFTQAAIKQLARYSAGLLRRINILADKAMLAAYADNSAQVKPKHVRTAARDSEFSTGSKDSGHGRTLLAIAAVLMLAVILILLLRTGPEDTKPVTGIEKAPSVALNPPVDGSGVSAEPGPEPAPAPAIEAPVAPVQTSEAPAAAYRFPGPDALITERQVRADRLQELLDRSRQSRP